MRIVATDLTKRYGTGENQVIALHKANLETQGCGILSPLSGPPVQERARFYTSSAVWIIPQRVLWNMMVRISIKERTRSCQHFAGEELGLFSKISFNSGPNSAGRTLSCPCCWIIVR